MFSMRRARKTVAKKAAEEYLSLEVAIPNHFRCPISLDLMKDPVTLSTGITYDRESIEKWIESGNRTCPVTNQVLTNVDQIPNHAIRRMIQDWCVANTSHGIDRIPTPRIPVSAGEVTQMLVRLEAATRRGDQGECSLAMKKIKNVMKESERNRRCVVANGTCAALSASFELLASASSVEKNAKILGEVLSLVTYMFPLNSEAQSYLGSRVSLHCMEWFLNSGDIMGRRNATLVLRELVSMDEKHVFALAKIDGVIEPLTRLIKEPICPTTTKSALMIIYYLLSTSEVHKSRFAKAGLVPLLVETLIDSERSVSEKALAVLDEISGSKEGRDMAYSHSLTMPVLVKKLLRVSGLATEFAVSAVWKLCKNETREEGGVVVEAMEVGAFQKILLLLQMGCDERTKEKCSELLKLLNLYRGRSECVDSVDFKRLVKPF